jgi:integrase/recombinase XerD
LGSFLLIFGKANVIQSLTKEELERLLRAAQAHRERDRLMFAVIYNHGLRVSELLALTPDSLDGGKLDVRRLKGSKRTIHELIASENPLFNERDPLFALALKTPRKQKLFPITRRRVDQLVKQYGEQADIPKRKRHVHALKHSLCTHVIDAVGVPKLQVYVGHTSGASTLIYTRQSDEVANASVQQALKV